MWGCIDSLAEVKIKSIHCSPFIHLDTHLIIEDDLVGQAWSTSHKTTLTTPKHLPIFHLSGNSFQDLLLYDLPRDWGEANWPIIHWVLLALLENRSLLFSWPQESLPITRIFQREWPPNDINQLHQHAWIHPIRPKGLVCPACSLTWSYPPKGNSSLLQSFPLVSAWDCWSLDLPGKTDVKKKPSTSPFSIFLAFRSHSTSDLHSSYSLHCP